MTTRRVICVGDVHGCIDELKLLLEKVEYRQGEDRLIFVGDLVDRGPNSRAVVDLAMEYKAECVLGNHEETQLQKYYRKWKKQGAPTNPDIIASSLQWRSEEHKRTFLQLEEKHFEWMETLPCYIELPEYNAVVVHAGVLPTAPLNKQEQYVFCHLSNCNEPTNDATTMKSWWASKKPATAQFWPHWYKGQFGRVIFGHCVFEKPFISEHAVGIDTGVPFGGSLTALILPEWETISIQAKERYYNRGPSDGRQVLNYEVWPGVFVYS